MKITFPQMGNVWIPLKTLLEDLGHEVILPPPCTRRTLSLGTKYAPESACLPLKINIGNYIEAFEKGAEVILMAGGVGPCRFGFYGHVAKEILTDLGYQFEMIILEPPGENYGQLLGGLSRIGNGKNARTVISTLRLAAEKFRGVDLLEKAVLVYRGRAEQPAEATRLYQKALKKLAAASSVTQARKAYRDGVDALRALKTHPERPLARIGVVGEIYTVLEPSASLNIEEKLGNMGAEIERTMFIGEWVWRHIILSPLRFIWQSELKALARPYLHHFVGGHGLESVANTVRLARQGLDGVVHVLPFTCMPEIVAQSILPTVSKNERIPVMTVVLDEHSGEAGLITRLEAFLDLLTRVKERTGGDLSEQTVSGHRRGFSFN